MKLNIKKTLQQAIAAHKEGKLQDAERLYLSILQSYPNHPEANQNLGVLETNKLIQLFQNSQYDEAIKLGQSLTERFPKHQFAWKILGAVLGQTGRHSEALNASQTAAALPPQDAQVHYNLGITLKELGRLDEAEASYRQAIVLQPDNAQAHNNLGVTLKELGRLDEAEVSCRQAIALQPGFAQAHSNLGLILQTLGRLDEAEVSCRQAIALQPGYAKAHNNLGVTLKELGRLDEAEASYRQAIALKADYAQAHNNLGVTLQELGILDEAEASLRQAIALKADYAEAHKNLSLTLQELGKFDEAIKILKNVINKDKKKYSYLYCDILHLKTHEYSWDDYDFYLNEINKFVNKTNGYVNNFSLLSISDNLSFLQKNARNNARKTSKAIYPKLPLNVKLKNENHKIKIAYFSLDFKDHAVGRLVKNLFKNHNRKKFIVYGFSFARHEDDNIYKEIKKTFDHFYDFSEKSDSTALQTISDLGLDVAIDMMGHTKGSRSYLFNNRIAPTQISFLGYLGTMGDNAYDYIVADNFVIPTENEKYYDEKVLKLPIYQPNNYKEISFKTISKKSLGLPDNSFIYCCLNNPYKVTPFIFDSWIKILQATENTYLYLLKRNNNGEKNIKKYISNKGLDPRRIIFTDKVSYEKYLSILNVCDVFLDTSPYNAGATAIDCLAANTPIISLVGNSYVSRMCGSILKKLELSDFIAVDIDDYISKAVALTKKPKVKINLEKFNIFEISNFVLNFEKELIKIHK